MTKKILQPQAECRAGGTDSEAAAVAVVNATSCDKHSMPMRSQVQTWFKHVCQCVRRLTKAEHCCTQRAQQVSRVAHGQAHLHLHIC